MNIPEGATHYHIIPTLRLVVFYKMIGGVWHELMSTNQGWSPLSYSPSGLRKIEGFPNEIR